MTRSRWKQRRRWPTIERRRSPWLAPQKWIVTCGRFTLACEYRRQRLP